MRCSPRFVIKQKISRQRVSSTAVSNTAVSNTAKDTFGYDALRPGQQEAIDSILFGRDTIAILPTGAGKSAIIRSPPYFWTVPLS